MVKKKEGTPLLVIGLGGTGSEAAASVKCAFKEYYEIPEGKDCPPHTRFLVIDTDINEQKKHNWREYEFFSIDNNVSILRNLQPWEKTWFDPYFKNPENMLGSGHYTYLYLYRQIARLLLFRRVDQMCASIEDAIRDVMAGSGNASTDRTLEIQILAGISGGTGSGTILDVPYLVRYVLESRLHMSRHSYALEGILVMPDVTIDHYAQYDPVMKELYETNGYAALKEIDYWMYYESHHHRYRQKYSNNVEIEWLGRPYDDLILLNASMLGGTHIWNAYSHIMHVIAEYLMISFSDRNAMHSNALAQLRSMRKEYFVPYCYCSIGACSNEPENNAILDRQWLMILDSIIARLESTETAAHMEGNDPVVFKDTCIDRGVGRNWDSVLHKLYEQRHPVPDAFGNMTAADLRGRDYSNAPHGYEFEIWKETLTRQKGDDWHVLENQGKRLLHDIFAEVVCDPQRGPQHCYDLLSHPIKGLIATLEEEKKIAQLRKLEADAFVRDHSGTSGICSGMMTELKNLGIRWLFESARRFDQYRESVIDLYNAARASNYYAALYGVMTELIIYVYEYKDLLGDIITGLRARQAEYNKRVMAARENAEGAIRLLDDAKVEGFLTSAFIDQQQTEGLIKTAYQMVADAVDKAQAKNQTSYTVREVAELIREGIDSERVNCFSFIDNMGIEEKLRQFGTMNGQNMVSYTERTIMPTLERGATPMFNANYTLSPDLNNVAMSHIGIVPGYARQIQAGIHWHMANQANSSAIIKLSDDPDRLSWLTYIIGMPLMAYTGLGDMYSSYLKKHRSMSAHICMNADHSLDDIQGQDWSFLPEPICHRYSNLTDVEKEVQAIHKAGVLKIDVHFHYENGRYIPRINIQWKKQNLICSAPYVAISDIEKNIETALEGKPDLDARVSALQALLENYTLDTIRLDDLEEKARAWAVVLGVGEDVSTTIGAWLPDAERERLQNAWKISCERAVYEYVSRNPQLLGYMRTNKECFDLIDAHIRKENNAAPEAVAKND